MQVARHGLASLVCGALLLAGGAGSALGQTAGRPIIPEKPPPAAVAPLDARLEAVVDAFRTGGQLAAARAAKAQRVRLSPQGALVVVGAKSSVGATRTAIASAGGRVSGVGGRSLEARVPLAKLRGLARDVRVERIDAPMLFTADVVSEGAAVTRAPLWHGAGFTGSGVKVAILDPGFQGYQALLGTELPASVETHNLCEPGAITGTTNHGTAVAEIVHDVAPGASLRLICFDSEIDLQTAVNQAVSAGVSVIVHSVSWFNVGRGDGTGGALTPDGAALSARTQGVLWVNSAGNQRQKHWSGQWSDPDSDDLLDWMSGQPFNQFTIQNGESVCATLKWDAWPVTDQDFDFYLVDIAELEIVAGSEGFQTGTQPPVEELCWQSTRPTGTFALIVSRFSANTAPRFDVFYLGASSPLIRVEAGSVTEPASSPAALAVGASCRTNNVVETFSSIGPTIDGRPKPEVVGPNAVSTAALGGSSSCANGFRGTSASAPHIGGLAALAKQRTPSLTSGGIAGYVEMLARTNDPGSRNVFLPAALDGGPIAYSIASGADLFGYANADGSTLPSPIFQGGSKSTPHFSPDGTKIAFTAKVGTQDTELYLADPDGSGRVVLTTGGAAGPDWNPAGTQLYFIRANEIWRVNTDGTGLVQLTTSGEDPIGPLDVSPDGTKIVYAGVDHLPGGYIQFGLFVVNSNGTGATKIANGDGTGMGAHFSPNGSRIAFHRNVSSFEIYTINPDGTGEVQVTATPFPEDDTDPVWTPDGDIVFVSDREATGASWTQLYRMEANGTGLVRLTSRVGGSSFAAPEIGPANAKPIALDSPTIVGTFQQGKYVVASPVAWAGGAPFTVARQWHRCNTAGASCSAIAGATDLFYGVTALDLGGTLRYTETASNGGGSTSAYFGLPGSIAPPLILGEPWLNITVQSVTLTATTGTWQGSPSQFTYRWQRGRVGEGGRESWQDVVSGPSPTRTLGVADLGSRVRVIVTASNSVGSATSSFSAATIVLGGQPVPSLDVRVDTSSQPYRAIPGAWRAYPAPTISWQWFRWPPGSSPTPIPGAVGLTYQPTADDVGGVLYVQEFAQNSFGAGFTNSSVTPAVGLLNTVPPALTGTAQVGATLTSSTGSWSPASGLSFSFRWQRTQDGERWRDIPGATSAEYVIAAGDAGVRLRSIVTASGGAGSASAQSAPTTQVVP